MMAASRAAVWEREREEIADIESRCLGFRRRAGLFADGRREYFESALCLRQIMTRSRSLFGRLFARRPYNLLQRCTNHTALPSDPFLACRRVSEFPIRLSVMYRTKETGSKPDGQRWYVRYAYILGLLSPQRLTSHLRSIVFIPDQRISVKSRGLKKPINYAACLAHFPNLVAVRNTTSLNAQQKPFRIPLPSLNTLDAVLPSSLLPPLTGKPPAMRKLVLRLVPHAVTVYVPSERALARTIVRTAQHVEQLWLHLASFVARKMGKRTSGRKKEEERQEGVTRTDGLRVEVAVAVVAPCGAGDQSGSVDSG
jgi:hypothetical protein